MTPQFPSYEVQEELGRGGMGVVYAARHRQSGAEVVIKLMLARNPGPEALERFRREALALAALSHPSVVRIKELGEHEGRPFFVMERIFGRTLNERIEASIRSRGRVPPFDWTGKIFTELASALAACHRQGITHRDLKPANILIEDGSERPVLLDFGLVKRAAGADEKELESLTKTGTMIGTPQYMAPEQLDPGADFGEVGSGTDIWGFGGCMVFALTGRPPVESQTQLELIALILGQDPPLPRERDRTVPRWLNEVSGACLRRDSGLRPSAEELVLALGQRNSGSLSSLRPSFSAPVRSLALSLGLLLVLGLGLALAFRDRSPPTLRFPKTTPSLTKLEHIILSGQVVDLNPARVIIRGRSHAVDPSGAFRIRIRLKPGLNKLSLRAEDAAGNRSPPSLLRIRLDQTAPRIEIKALPKTIHPLRIHGSLSEENCRIRIGATQATVTGKRFEFANASISPGRPLCLVATDKAGNEARLLIPQFAVVSSSGSGTHKTLRGALAAVPAGGLLLIQPGLHTVNSLSISKAVTICGDSDRPRPRLQAVGASVFTINTELKSIIRLERLDISQRGHSSAATLHLTRGHLELAQCRISEGGVAALHAEPATTAKAGESIFGVEVSGRGIEFVRGAGLAIILARCKAKFFDSRVTDAGLGSTLNSLALSRYKTAAIQVREGCEVLLQGFKIHKAWDRAITSVESRLTLRRLFISHAAREGLRLEDSVTRLEDVRIDRCAEEGIVINGGRLEMFGGSVTKSGGKFGGLALEGEARGVIRGVSFRGNAIGGAVQVRSHARVDATDCHFEGNLGGRFLVKEKGRFTERGSH